MSDRIRQVRAGDLRKNIFSKYTFTGKLGVDGAAIKIAESGTDTYTVSIPEFG